MQVAIQEREALRSRTIFLFDQRFHRERSVFQMAKFYADNVQKVGSYRQWKIVENDSASEPFTPEGRSQTEIYQQTFHG